MEGAKTRMSDCSALSCLRDADNNGGKQRARKSTQLQQRKGKGEAGVGWRRDCIRGEEEREGREGK